MARSAKTLDRILRAASDGNIRFDELCRLLKRLGFAERIRGDHHIFTRDGVEEILNLQPRGSLAKAYQVKQVRNVIIQYRLAEEQDAE
jgi:predicted RNA binding protein YcfA (HicA-like mRNA interferase family)